MEESDIDTSSLPSRVGPFTLDSRSTSQSTVPEGEPGIQAPFTAMDSRENTRIDRPPSPPPSSPHSEPFRRGAGLTPTPIRGDFIDVSSPTRNPSTPPHLDEASLAHGITLHLSLTDSQMDRLAEVISRPSSPEKSASRRGRDDGAPTLPHSHARAYSEDEILTSPALDRFRHLAKPHIPRTHASTRSRTQSRRSDQQRSARQREAAAVDTADMARGSRSRSPAKRSDPRQDCSQSTVSSIAQRRGAPHPSVDTAAAQRQGSPSHRRTPIEILRRADANPAAHDQSWHTVTSSDSVLERPSSSIYPTTGVSYYHEDDYESIAPVSPSDTTDPAEETGAAMEPEIQRSLAEYESLYTRSAPGPRHHETAAAAAEPALLSVKTGTGQVEHGPRVYSPLTPYLESMHARVPRHKVLIGQHGWLERTGEAAADGAGPPPPPKKGIFESLKKVAKEVAELAEIKPSSSSRGPARNHHSHNRHRHQQHQQQQQNQARLDISLDPREQSLLYCELEFLLTTALDGYLTAQFRTGRVRADRLSKVAEAWRHKGRPRVVGFRYDVEAQLDIVLLHLHEFEFHVAAADAARGAAAVAGVLDMMRADARAMRVRSFCQPDLAIAKQLLDAQRLFNVLGCPAQLQLQLREVVRFFRVALARRKRPAPEVVRTVPGLA